MNAKKMSLLLWISSFISILMLGGVVIFMIIIDYNQNINILLYTPLVLVPLFALAVLQIIFFASNWEMYKSLLRYYKWKRKKLLKEKDVTFILLLVFLFMSLIAILAIYIAGVVVGISSTVTWSFYGAFFAFSLLTSPLHYFKLYKMTDEEIQQFLQAVTPQMPQYYHPQNNVNNQINNEEANKQNQ